MPQDCTQRTHGSPKRQSEQGWKQTEEQITNRNVIISYATLRDHKLALRLAQSKPHANWHQREHVCLRKNTNTNTHKSERLRIVVNIANTAL